MTKNWCFSTWVFETKSVDAEQKQNLKSGKTKIRKRDLKEKARQETKQKRIDEKAFAIEHFDVVPFMKLKQRRQKTKSKKETKTSNQKKAKKKNQKEERKKRATERERERERDIYIYIGRESKRN